MPHVLRKKPQTLKEKKLKELSGFVSTSNSCQSYIRIEMCHKMQTAVVKGSSYCYKKKKKLNTVVC